MAKIMFIGLIAYLSLASLIQLFLNPAHAKREGSSRWANRIPNYLMLVLGCTYLLIYPFTETPYRYSQFLSITVSKHYILLIISIFTYHMITIGITGIKKNIKSGVPMSFLAHYFRLFFSKKSLNDHRDGADILLAQEYAVIGTSGGLLGSVNFFEIASHLNPIASFFMFGVVASLCYSLVAKVWQAKYY